MSTNSSDWRAPLYDSHQYLRWWAGLLSAVLASGLSYYVTSLYADLLTAKRRRQSDFIGQSGANGEIVINNKGPQVKTSLRARILVILSLCFCLFATLDVVSLAILPLTLVIPVVSWCLKDFASVLLTV